MVIFNKLYRLYYAHMVHNSRKEELRKMKKVRSFVSGFAYVGGDAYNYIINGNYATAFFVLTLTFAMLGIGFCVLAYMTKMSASFTATTTSSEACIDDSSENIEATSLLVENPESANMPVGRFDA